MSTSLEGAMSETERVVRSLLGQATAEAEALVNKHPMQKRTGGPIVPQLEGDGRGTVEAEADKVNEAGEAAKESVTGKPQASETKAVKEQELSSALRNSLLDISTINAQLINAGPARILELMQTPFQQENV